MQIFHEKEINTPMTVITNFFRVRRSAVALISIATVGSITLASTLVAAQPKPLLSAPAVAPSTKPTIVMVHGGYADSSSWSKVIPLLTAEGYTVDAAPNPLRGLYSDSAYVRSFLKSITGPIVLVGHPYGGMVITNAATGNPNVKALVYVDAFVPDQGDTALHLIFAKPGSCFYGGGNLHNTMIFRDDPSLPANDPVLYIKYAPGPDFTGFDACFANDLPTSEADVLWAVQRPIALDAFTQVSGVPAWKTIPSWAVLGTQDHAIPPAELQFMDQRAGAQITYVKAGHLSMISDPSVVAKVVTEAATATS
jgi:pimeloyl-ACP methyl ester carboxylesterase